MAIAGAAGPGQWMRWDGKRLHRGRIETTIITERDYQRALQRLSNGERVHVDVYASMHLRVAAHFHKVEVALRDDPTHTLCLAGALE